MEKLPNGIYLRGHLYADGIHQQNCPACKAHPEPLTTEQKVTLVEIVWLDEDGNVIETANGVDQADASQSLLRKMARSERDIQHGDRFETAEYTDE